MGEKRIVVDGLTIEYNGLFSLNELWILIDKWTRERYYDRSENKNYQFLTKEGRDIEIEIEPYKGINDYVKIYIKINIVIKGMKDVVVKKDKQMLKLNKGSLKVSFVGYMLTDYENKWEGKPLLYFLRMVIDRFIYQISANRYESYIAEEVGHLYQNIKSLLNLYRY